MGDDLGLSRLHREEVAREIRVLRGPGRPGGSRGEPGRLVTFWRELGLDVARLAGVFGRSPLTARKRKGAL